MNFCPYCSQLSSDLGEGGNFAHKMLISSYSVAVSFVKTGELKTTFC